MKHFTLFFLALASAHCGGTVAAPAPGASSDSGAVTPEAWVETASCADIEASCVGGEAKSVRGHAAGLVGLDDARVEFAVRYLTDTGSGLDVPHGVALGRTRVHDGGFATCVCVPHGASMYPEVAAVVYAIGSTDTSSKDVVRASYSQRYATLGDEDVADVLGVVPSALAKEAAVAAMIERSAAVTLTNIGKADGKPVVAGLVADDRPVAPQLSSGGVEAGKVALHWNLPGKASSSERLAFFVDQNGNGLCDVDGGDTGGFAPATSTSDFSAGTWLSGGALAPVCDALQSGAPRD